MSPRIGDDQDYVSIEPTKRGTIKVRYRFSAATVIALLFLLSACGALAFYLSQKGF